MMMKRDNSGKSYLLSTLTKTLKKKLFLRHGVQSENKEIITKTVVYAWIYFMSYDIFSAL